MESKIRAAMATSINFTAKKRKVDKERRLLQKRLTLEYFFVNSNEKPKCLIWDKIASATKEYKVKQYYKTNHSGLHTENCMEMIGSRK